MSTNFEERRSHTRQCKNAILLAFKAATSVCLSVCPHYTSTCQYLRGICSKTPPANYSPLLRSEARRRHQIRARGHLPQPPQPPQTPQGARLPAGGYVSLCVANSPLPPGMGLSLQRLPGEHHEVTGRKREENSREFAYMRDAKSGNRCGTPPLIGFLVDAVVKESSGER